MKFSILVVEDLLYLPTILPLKSGPLEKND